MFCSVILINFWLVGRYFPIMITRFKLDILFGKVFVCNILLRIVLFLSQIQRIKWKNPLSNAGTSMCIDQYKSVQHDGIHLLSFIVTLLIFNNDKKNTTIKRLIKNGRILFMLHFFLHYKTYKASLDKGKTKHGKTIDVIRQHSMILDLFESTLVHRAIWFLQYELEIKG